MFISRTRTQRLQLTVAKLRAVDTFSVPETLLLVLTYMHDHNQKLPRKSAGDQATVPSSVSMSLSVQKGQMYCKPPVRRPPAHVVHICHKYAGVSLLYQVQAACSLQLVTTTLSQAAGQISHATSDSKCLLIGCRLARERSTRPAVSTSKRPAYNAGYIKQ